MNTEVAVKQKKPRREREVTSRVARFVNAQIEFLKGHKSQIDIAEEAGYAKPNIITMFKNGDTRLPLANINRIAKALEVDPVQLTRLAVKEYEPEVWLAITESLGDPITKNERKMVELFRELTELNDYEMTEQDEIEAFKAFVEKVKANKAKTATTRTVM